MAFVEAFHALLYAFFTSINTGAYDKGVIMYAIQHNEQVPQDLGTHSLFEGLTNQDQERFFRFGFAAEKALPYPYLHQAFEQQVKLYPNHIAVEHEGKTLSYKNLNQQADLLAYQLQQLGIGLGDSVGLYIERSMEMVISILAILKVGATYVPQDARLTKVPQLLYVSKNSNVKLILSLSKFNSTIANLKTDALYVDDFLQTHKSKVVKPQLSAYKVPHEQIAFVLYTSGTTGLPNGVQVSHKNVCNILHIKPGNLNVKAGDKVSQILNIAFDMAAWEIFTALSHGASLLIRGKDIEATAKRADIIIATPSILGSFTDTQNFQAKTIAVAGEPCSIDLAEKWSKEVKFYNCCGPTETTIVNTMHLYQKGSKNLSIGKPTPNNSVYILDENLKPLPIGEIGEMWAGGDCVTAFYAKNPDLNLERYRKDPFRPGHYMFRTRDLGRWNLNGELEHFGRTDDQVKIRGFRVELDSVSSVIEKMDTCKQAVSLKLSDKHLVSFVRPNAVNTEEAKGLVAVELPYYCEPLRVFALDQFPLTDRGKIDKKALTKMAVKKLEEENLL